MVNSILIPMIANRYIKNNIYSPNGLADDVFLLGITNALVGPALKLVDPYYFFNKVKACLKSRPGIYLSLNVVSKLNQSQKELNAVMERI